MSTPCEIIYNLSTKPIYGSIDGVCRITGKQSVGVPFNKWVRDTFTDIGNLHPGTIISNEAMFCFEEGSEYLQQKAGKDKPQRFRNYSHFVLNNEWHMKDKGQKEDMLTLTLSKPEICVIAETGQRHLVFKHKPGTWQFEDVTIYPDVDLLTYLHSLVYSLCCTFSIDEVSSGQYSQHRILKHGVPYWRSAEDQIKEYRGTPIFLLSLFFAKVQLT
jgi:hypothetical protein